MKKALLLIILILLLSGCEIQLGTPVDDVIEYNEKMADSCDRMEMGKSVNSLGYVVCSEL
jgi:hypothetical protein